MSENFDAEATGEHDSAEEDAAQDPSAAQTDSPSGEGEGSGDQDDTIAARSYGPLIPDPIRPADGAVIDQPSVNLEWEHVPEAETYELQIATDRRFESTMFDGRVGSSSRFTYSGLPSQEGVSLFWRVRAFRANDGWTQYGTVGTFELADWRPEQPDIPEDPANGRAMTGDTASADSRWTRSRVVAAIVTALAVGIAVFYVRWGPETETSGQMTVPGDTIDMRPQQPIPNEDGETYRISIDEAMKQYVEQSGGTWEDDTSASSPTESQPP